MLMKQPVHINDFAKCGQNLGGVAQYVDAHYRDRDSSHSHLRNYWTNQGKGLLWAFVGGCQHCLRGLIGSLPVPMRDPIGHRVQWKSKVASDMDGGGVGGGNDDQPPFCEVCDGRCGEETGFPAIKSFLGSSPHISPFTDMIIR